MRSKQCCILTWLPPGFCIGQQAWMNVKVCPKKPRSQQFSGFSSEMGVANSVVMTCPETLTHQCQNVISGHPEAAEIPKSGEGLRPFEPHLKGGHPSLKSPRCVRFSPKEQRKTGVFLRFFFVFFNLAQFHHILTFFAQVMVSKASVTNYNA